MKRLEILQRINKYVKDFRVSGVDLVPVLVTSQGDATSCLAKLSGDRILIARPEVHRDGDSDSFRSEVSLAFFVLAKDLGQAYTPEKGNDMFDRLAGLVTEVLDKFSYDTTACSLLAGLKVDTVDIVPESSIFGGWTGYSIDIVLS